MTTTKIPKQVLQHFVKPPTRIVLEHRMTPAVAAPHAPLLLLRDKRLCKALQATIEQETTECADERETARERARIALKARYGGWQ